MKNFEKEVNDMKQKQRISYTISRSNPLTWLSALLALAAFAGFLARAFWFRQPDTGCWALWLDAE